MSDALASSGQDSYCTKNRMMAHGSSLREFVPVVVAVDSDIRAG